MDRQVSSGRQRAVRIIENTRVFLGLALDEVSLARLKLDSDFTGDSEQVLVEAIDRMSRFVITAAAWMDAEREALAKSGMKREKHLS